MEKDLNGFGQGQHRPMGLAGTGGLENAKTGLEGPFFFASALRSIAARTAPTKTSYHKSCGSGPGRDKAQRAFNDYFC